MEAKEVKNWEELEFELQNLYSERDRMITTQREILAPVNEAFREIPIPGFNGSESDLKYVGVSEFLFRGQADSNWKIETTLDRYSEKEFSLPDYYDLIYAAKPTIETFTDRTWDIPSGDEYRNNIRRDRNIIAKPDPYMVYMRHHGFPSPFLDWTKSPYVAAFFAYRNVEKEVKNVSIYVYLENTGNQENISESDPLIITVAPFVRTHKRHFLQQSQYTFCGQHKNGTDYYVKPEDVFSKNEQDRNRLWKFNLPASERINFLKKLDSMNINAFSLFGSEESLMETIALRKIEFKA